MSAPPVTDRTAVIDELRRAVGELLGAERRLRGRDRRGAHGLSFSEVRALIALGRAEDGTATAGALAKAADLNPGTVTALLDSLEERGIATRRRAEEDRRCVVVSLTAEGREKLAEATAKWQARLDEALAGVPDDEVVAAAGVLRRLVGAFDSV
jgi:DNA-binding MarR family transcriptional regulator